MVDPNDPILYWNAIALEANRITHSTTPAGPQAGPTMSSRALALVHVAMYDAYAGTTGKDPYLQNTAFPVPGTNTRAAISAAACTMLSRLYPDSRLLFEASAAAAGVDPAGADTSAKYGRQVALEVASRLAVKADEPGASDIGYVASTARGCHRPDPDNPALGYHGPFYGDTAQPFAVAIPHELPSPAGWLDPDNPAYVKDLAVKDYVDAVEEVIDLGGAPGLPTTKRTPAQTVAGIYWAYDGARLLGTPPRLYNQIVRRILETSTTTFTLDDTALLFALVNAAMGDAGKFAWREKYRHDIWRPVVGVREHDPAMGPTATPGMGSTKLGDPFWLPLGAPRTNTNEKSFTPPFPAYPSGHATFGAAAFQILRLYLRFKADPTTKYGMPVTDPQFIDTFAFDFVSGELDGLSTDRGGTLRTRHERHFSSLWHAIFENGLSRVFLGVHWGFDAFDAKDVRKGNGFKDPDKITYNSAVGGVPLGLAIANDIWSRGLKESPPMMTAGVQPSRGRLQRLNLESTNIR